MMVRCTLPILLTVLLAAPSAARAQHQHGGPAEKAPDGWRLRAGAHAVPLVTHVTPILRGDSRTEAYLTQPMLMAELTGAGGRLALLATVSAEALTLERGELGAGVYGEGYVDRRHPHTWAHELLAMATAAAGPAAVSLTAGRGFVPFGTDDPMVRPFVKYPVNHHLAQVLERLVLVAGVRAGPLLAEAAIFGGNEPASPGDLGRVDRFADSWAARLTLLPLPGLELQGSRAWVVSPEMPTGGGWDQRKWSTSVRYERDLGVGRMYGLAEWARTTEVSKGRDVLELHSALGEVALDRHGWRPALRLEVSERAEGERTFDPFRAPWPHADAHILGITRWTIASARLERATTLGRIGVAPFVEGSFSHVAETTGGLFEPEPFYGSTRIWTLNIGARLGAGMHRPRMGRYGVAATAGDDR